MAKIGILGGTFNPIHVGHLLLAEWAKDALDLDEIWFIPSGCSYMKAGLSVLPGRERVKMVELAIEDSKDFKCLDLEILREGATYTYETLQELHSLHPEDAFYFITGADCLFQLEKWMHPEKILEQATLVAAIRDHSSMEQLEQMKEKLLKKWKGEILLLPFLRFSVTSTEIRERIAQGKSVHYLVPEKTLGYIMEKGYYRDDK